MTNQVAAFCLVAVALLEKREEDILFEDPMNAHVGYHPEVKLTPGEEEILEAASVVNNDALSEAWEAWREGRGPHPYAGE